MICINNKEALCKMSELLVHSSMRIQIFLQGVLEKILDTWLESWWLWLSGMTNINIKEFQTYRCTCEHSHLSLQSNLQGVLEDNLDSRMEYRWLWTSRMTCINIKEALCKISGPMVHWKRIFSFVSPERPPRNLGGHSWFLNGWCPDDFGRQEWHT